MDTLVFSNDKIKYTNCNMSGGKLSLSIAESYDLAEGSLINGVITNRDEVLEKLTAIVNAHKLKKVGLCIDSSKVITKLQKMPAGNQKTMFSFVKAEFLELDMGFEDPIYDYSLLAQPTKEEPLASVLGVCCERSFIKEYIDLFATLGVSVASVDIEINATIKLASNLFTADDTYILAVVEQTNIMLCLFVGGKYYFSTRGRILEEHNSERFVQDFVAKISSIIQFNKSQKNTSKIENVYVTGVDANVVENVRTATESIGLTTQYLDIGERLINENSFIMKNCVDKYVDKYICNYGCACKMRL